MHINADTLCIHYPGESRGSERAVSFSQSGLKTGAQPHCGRQALMPVLSFNDLHVRIQATLWSKAASQTGSRLLLPSWTRHFQGQEK